MGTLDEILLEYEGGSQTFYVSDVKPREGTYVGWNVDQGTIEGYNKLVSLYGAPKVVRVFSAPGKGIMPWSNPILSALPDDVNLIYSVKDWPVDVRGWMTAKPSRFTNPVYFCLDHEPEQGPTKGDPDPATFQKEWGELIANVSDHPRRSEFRLTPIFTEYYAKKYPAEFEKNFFVVASYAGVDAVGFDIYDTSYAKFRGAIERNALPLKYARQVGKELVIAEWGIDKKSYDTTGEIRAAQIRENIYYLRSLADNRVKLVAWFHSLDTEIYTDTVAQAALRQVIKSSPLDS